MINFNAEDTEAQRPQRRDVRFVQSRFDSKVRSHRWTRSVQPAVAGGCVAVQGLTFITTGLKAAHPSATADGTDLFQGRRPDY
jgi:hypothetical protein